MLFTSWRKWLNQFSTAVQPERSRRSHRPAQQRRRLTVERLEDRVVPAFNMTISNNPTVNVTPTTVGIPATTVIFEANALGANLSWADITTALTTQNLNVVVDSGDGGTEAGHITDQTGANIANTDPADGKSLTFQSGTGTGLVGNITLLNVRLQGTGSSIVVNAANNVVVAGLLDSGLTGVNPLASVTINSDVGPADATGSTINLNGLIIATTVTVTGGPENDAVVFAAGVTVPTATINGAGGTDTLDYSASTTAVAVNLGLDVNGLEATLGGDQEVPPTTSTATGTATITNYDPIAKTFDIAVTVDGIVPGDVTGFHIHRAPVGVNGPVIIDLATLGTLTPIGTTGFTFTATGVALPALHEAAFLGGITYLNIHTAAFPNGIIRGQIFSTGNAASATGTATGTAAANNFENAIGGTAADSLVGNSLANSLTGGNGNDTMLGGPGNDTFAGGNSDDVMVWSNGDGTDVMDGNAGNDTVQVNGALGGGALNDSFTIAANGTRIDLDRVSTGPFGLDIGTTETLTVNGIAGTDTFSVSSLATVTDLARLNLNGFADNDTFNITAPPPAAIALNVHGGTGTDTLTAPNTPNTWTITGPNQGAVLGSMSSFIRTENLTGGTDTDNFLFSDGANVAGTIDGLGGTDTLDYSAYTTSVAANLGTNTPNLVATLGGDQEVPPTGSAATGTATLTYNNVAHTFDITVTVDGITPAQVTGFHIHRAPVGVNGPIIVDFVPGGTPIAPLTPTATGFTFTATGVALPALHEAAFLGGITYLNIHTAAFPAGLIRGQIFPGGLFVAATGTTTGAGSVANVENATGGSGNFTVGPATFGDSLVGNGGINLLRGGPGNDVLVAARGNDAVLGEGDDDIMVWSNGDGSDVMDGGTGSDLVNVNGALGADDVFTINPGNAGRLAFARTSPGPFTLDINATESLTVNGISGNDSFTANNLAGVADLAAVNLNGLEGNDTFAVTPSPTTTVNVNGHIPAAAPGDTLNLALDGAISPFVASSSTLGGTQGSYSFGNRQPVNFLALETQTPLPDLAIAKTATPTSAPAGSVVTYTIVVTNTGPVGASGVVVTDTFATGLTNVSFNRTFSSANSSSADPTEGTGNLNQTVNLAAGDSVTYIVTGTLAFTTRGTLGNTATVAPPAGLPNPAPDNDTATANITVTPGIHQATLGVFRPSNVTWFLRDANTVGPPTVPPFAYGSPTSIAVRGDWNADGVETIGVVDFDPSLNALVWKLRNSNGPGAPDLTVAYGGAGAIPVVGDWDGDGDATIGVVEVDPTNNTLVWKLRNSNTAGAPDITVVYGGAGSTPVAGDWNGDGIDTVGIVEVDPATKFLVWKLRNSNTAGAPDVTPFSYGILGQTAVVGDWDGDGDTTIGVYDPAGAIWQLRNTSSGGAPAIGPLAYGAPNDRPVPGALGGATTLHAAGGVGAGGAAISRADLDATVAAALARLAGAGVGSALVARLGSARFDVGNLSGSEVGTAVLGAGRAVLDAAAAGRGWFVDLTPQDDEEFARAGTAAEGRLDLLTAVLHEMGHLAGLGHSDSAGDLMADALADGARLTQALDRVFAGG